MQYPAIDNCKVNHVVKTRTGHLQLAAFTEYYLSHLINDIHSYFGFVISLWFLFSVIF